MNPPPDSLSMLLAVLLALIRKKKPRAGLLYARAKNYLSDDQS